MLGLHTHRCHGMPDGYSLRKYDYTCNMYTTCEPGGWVLAEIEFNPDTGVHSLYNFTPYCENHVRFCPWCGEKLE